MTGFRRGDRPGRPQTWWPMPSGIVITCPQCGCWTATRDRYSIDHDTGKVKPRFSCSAAACDWSDDICLEEYRA